MKEIFYDLLDRLKKHLDIKSDAGLARELGITPQALSSFKKQKKFPSDLIIKYCFNNKLSIDWLFTGEGPKYRNREEGGNCQQSMEKSAGGMQLIAQSGSPGSPVTQHIKTTNRERLPSNETTVHSVHKSKIQQPDAQQRERLPSNETSVQTHALTKSIISEENQDSKIPPKSGQPEEPYKYSAGSPAGLKLKQPPPPEYDGRNPIVDLLVIQLHRIYFQGDDIARAKLTTLLTALDPGEIT